MPTNLKRFVVKQVSKAPKLFAIWDKKEGDWVHFNQDPELPQIESPYPFTLEKIKRKLRND